MLLAIVISLLVGATIGVAAFLFGHSYATKYWNEIVGGLQKGKNAIEDEDERARLKNRL